MEFRPVLTPGHGLTCTNASPRYRPPMPPSAAGCETSLLTSSNCGACNTTCSEAETCGASGCECSECSPRGSTFLVQTAALVARAASWRHVVAVLAYVHEAVQKAGLDRLAASATRQAREGRTIVPLPRPRVGQGGRALTTMCQCCFPPPLQPTRTSQRAPTAAR